MVKDFINLTPHDIFYQRGNISLRFETSDYVARVETATEPHGKIKTLYDLHDVEIVKNRFGEITGFPFDEVKSFHVYIVSQMVLQAAYGNEKFNGITLVAPNTATGAIRNERGQVIGVNSFVTMEDLR